MITHNVSALVITPEKTKPLLQSLREKRHSISSFNNFSSFWALLLSGLLFTFQMWSKILHPTVGLYLLHLLITF